MEWVARCPADSIYMTKKTRAVPERPQYAKCTTDHRGRVCVCSYRDSHRHAKAINTRPNDEAELLLVRQPCRDRNIDDATRHAFDYFRQRTLLSLLKQSPTGGGWIRHAMALSDVEECIFHGLTAAAAAHQGLIEIVHSSLSRPVAASPTELALRHHSRAIGVLSEYIGTSVRRTKSLETVLLTSLLFVIFEILHGHHSNATQHIRFARRIVDELLPEGIEPRSEASRVAVKTIRVASSGLLNTPSSTTMYTLRENSSALPEQIAALASSLNLIIDATDSVCKDLREISRHGLQTTMSYQSLDLAHQTCLIHSSSRTVDLTEHHRVKRSLQQNFAKLIAWQDTFEHHLNTQQNKQSQGFILLRIRHFTSLFKLATCQETTECDVDRFNGTISHVLELIEIYLQRREEPVSLGVQRPWIDKSFHLAPITEHGILPALLLICVKCRNRDVRRRALDVLIRSRRIESEHSSGLLADFAKAIIDLEESHARQLTGISTECSNIRVETVPEQARFSDVVIAPVEGRSELFRIICSRFAHEKGGGIELMEHEALHENGNRILLL